MKAITNSNRQTRVQVNDVRNNDDGILPLFELWKVYLEIKLTWLPFDCRHNKDKTFLVWINEEDHTRMISMQKGGDMIAVFKRFCEGISKVCITWWQLSRAKSLILIVDFGHTQHNLLSLDGYLNLLQGSGNSWGNDTRFSIRKE